MGIINLLFGKKQAAPAHAEQKWRSIPQCTVQEDELPGCKRKRYRVAGISFRTEAIKALAIEEPAFSMTKADMIRERVDAVSQYRFQIQKVELVPEPENPEDPNAVKVVMDGQHIGYIKAGNCKHVLNVLKAGKAARIQGEIHGGQTKMLECYAAADEAPKAADYHLEKSSSEFSASVYIDEAE